MTNSKKYQEFLDYYLAQGYTYRIREIGIKEMARILQKP
jgi:hypothetical protein